MSRPSSRSSSGAIAALLVLHAVPAWAQACCTGSNAITPGRLAVHEDALAALQVRGAYVLGSWDARSHYAAAPARASEVDLEEAFIGSLRIARRAQVTAMLPIAETFRSAAGLSEAGVGFGDVQVGGRYDFVLAGESRWVPGIGLLASITWPTGVPPERATNPLATDATGVGSLRLAGGIALEQRYGPVLVNLTGTVVWSAARSTPAGLAQAGIEWSAFAALAWVLGSRGAVALTGAYTQELPGTLAGMQLEGGGRASTRVGLAGAATLTGGWRLSAGAYLDLPIDALGRSQPVQGGLTLLLLRSWS